MGIDRPRGTDTRAENVDKPPAEDRPQAPPSDQPGSPGQPSRLESLRAAREAQEARRAETGAQQKGLQETVEQQDDGKRDAPEPSPSEPTNEESETQPDLEGPGEKPKLGESKSEIGTGADESEREADRSQSGTEEVQRGERGGQPVLEDSGESIPEPYGETREGRRHGERDPTSPESGDAKSDASADTQTADVEAETGETARLDERGEEVPEHQGESVTEVPGDEPQPGKVDDNASRNQDLPSPPQHDDHEPGAESAESDRSSQGEPVSVDGQGGSADTQPPAQEPDRDADKPRPPAWPPITVAWPREVGGTAARWSSPVVRFNDQGPGSQVENRGRNGREQGETPATTDDEPNKYRRLPDLPHGGTPGRGELIPPEDDPADRNPDPEERRRSRWEPYDLVNSGIEGIKKATEGAKGYLEKPPPTGQAEVKIDSSNNNQPQINKANPTDVLSGTIILSTAVLGILLTAKDRINKSRRSNSENN